MARSRRPLRRKRPPKRGGRRRTWRTRVKGTKRQVGKKVPIKPRSGGLRGSRHPPRKYTPTPPAITTLPAPPITTTPTTQASPMGLVVFDPYSTPTSRVDLIPKHQDYMGYDDWQHVIKDLEAAHQLKMPMGIVGPAGTGKTEAVLAFAAKHKLPVYRLNFSRGTTEAKLVGGLQEAPGGGSYFHLGEVASAYKNGGILLLDEMNLGPTDVLDRLSDVLEMRDWIMLPEAGGLRINRHPDFLPVATLNPYGTVGRKELDAPMLSRFGIMRELGYPGAEKEMDLMKKRVGQLSDAETDALTTTIKLNQLLRRGDLPAVENLPYRPTLRESVAFAKLIKHGYSNKEIVDRVYTGKYAATGDPEAKENVRALALSAFKAPSGAGSVKEPVEPASS